jgi:hypothetical protein
MRRHYWLAIPAIVIAGASAHAESKLLTMLDTNKDGVLELEEVQTEAAAAFGRLIKEGPFGLVSQDKQDRYRRKFLAAVAKWFKAADADNNGKLDESEVEGPAGAKLLSQ